MCARVQGARHAMQYRACQSGLPEWYFQIVHKERQVLPPERGIVYSRGSLYR